ncbi:MAG: DUF2935 domain-containing protein [Lachnospiraceae bacterium]
MENFVSTSIGLHLFFMRIMKEHALFLQAGFQGKDEEFIKTADTFRKNFEELLEECVELGGRAVSDGIIDSHELVTPFTLNAEKKTQQLTGIPINSKITLSEQQLRNECTIHINRELVIKTRMLNQKALRLLNGLIQFKERILSEVRVCRLFTANYPLLIEHIVREAKLYQSFLIELIRRGRISPQNMRDTEMFWNQIMMEHAFFIRGLLDPTEEALIDTADDFSKEYKELLKVSRDVNDCTLEVLTQKSLETTLRYRDFKAAGTKGISDCDISSIILPLLADHVLREANHYLRLLEV